MKKFYTILLFFIVLLLQGCKKDQNFIVTDNHAMFAFLEGKLSDANVSIYSLEKNGSKTLLFKDITYDSENFDEAGRFLSHLNELEDDKFYIYEIKGGMERYDDDEYPRKNLGKIRLITKGEWIKNYPESINVSILSELLYLGVHKYFYRQEKLESKIELFVSKLFKEDITGDGKIDIYDLFAFNPSSDKNKLNIRFDICKNLFQTIGYKIRNGYTSYLDIFFKTFIVKTFPLEKQKKIKKIIFSKNGEYLFTLENEYYNNGSSKKYKIIIYHIDDSLNVQKISQITRNYQKIENFILSNDEKKLFVLTDKGNPINPIFLEAFDISDKRKITQIIENYPIDPIYAMFSILQISTDDKTLYLCTYSYATKKMELIGLDITDINNPFIKYYGEYPAYISIKKIIPLNNNILYLIGKRFIYAAVKEENNFIIKKIYKTGWDINYHKNIKLSKDKKKMIIVARSRIHYYLSYAMEVKIFDISDPLNPKKIGKLLSNHSAKRIELSPNEDILYISLFDQIYIIDTKDISNPKWISTMRLPKNIRFSNGAIRLYKNDNILLLIDKNLNLNIIETSFSDNPKIITRYSFLTPIIDFTIASDEKGFYFITCFANGHISFCSLRKQKIPDIFSIDPSKYSPVFIEDLHSCYCSPLAGKNVRVNKKEDKIFIYIKDLSSIENPECMEAWILQKRDDMFYKLNKFHLNNTQNGFVISDNGEKALKMIPKNNKINIYEIDENEYKYLYSFNFYPKKEIKNGTFLFQEVETPKYHRIYDIQIIDKKLFE